MPKTEPVSSDEEAGGGGGPLDDKAEQRRERNRQAAKRVRERRVGAIKALNDQVSVLHILNERLRQALTASVSGQPVPYPMHELLQAPPELPEAAEEVLVRLKFQAEKRPLALGEVYGPAATPPPPSATATPAAPPPQQPGPSGAGPSAPAARVLYGVPGPLRSVAVQTDPAGAMRARPTAAVLGVAAMLHQQARELLQRPEGPPPASLDQLQAMVELQALMKHVMGPFMAAQQEEMRQQAARLAAGGGSGGAGAAGATPLAAAAAQQRPQQAAPGTPPVQQQPDEAMRERQQEAVLPVLHDEHRRLPQAAAAAAQHQQHQPPLQQQQPRARPAATAGAKRPADEEWSGPVVPIVALVGQQGEEEEEHEMYAMQQQQHRELQEQQQQRAQQGQPPGAGPAAGPAQGEWPPPSAPSPQQTPPPPSPAPTPASACTPQAQSAGTPPAPAGSAGTPPPPAQHPQAPLEPHSVHPELHVIAPQVPLFVAIGDAGGAAGAAAARAAGAGPGLTVPLPVAPPLQLVPPPPAACMGAAGDEEMLSQSQARFARLLSQLEALEGGAAAGGGIGTASAGFGAVAMSMDGLAEKLSNFSLDLNLASDELLRGMPAPPPLGQDSRHEATWM